MKPRIKAQLTKAFQIAFDNAENSAERTKLYKSAQELGINLEYLNENFNGLKNLLL